MPVGGTTDINRRRQGGRARDAGGDDACLSRLCLWHGGMVPGSHIKQHCDATGVWPLRREPFRWVSEHFMDAWDSSSASENASFCEHWVLSLREYTDSYDQPDISVKPVSTYKGKKVLRNRKKVFWKNC